MTRPTLRLAPTRAPATTAPPELVYHELVLPVRHESGITYHMSHAILANALTELAGGFTKFSDCAGQWKAPNGRIVREMVVVYRVACDAKTWGAILSKVFALFEREQSIFSARLGTAQIIDRKKETANVA